MLALSAGCVENPSFLNSGSHNIGDGHRLYRILEVLGKDRSTIIILSWIFVSVIFFGRCTRLWLDVLDMVRCTRKICIVLYLLAYLDK